MSIVRLFCPLCGRHLLGVQGTLFPKDPRANTGRQTSKNRSEQKPFSISIKCPSCGARATIAVMQPPTKDEGYKLVSGK